MNYSIIVESLSQATLFDLYRLSKAIQHLMDNEERQNAIKGSISIGQRVQYFNGRENREATGFILKIKRTSVLVKAEHDHNVWSVPLCALNLQGVDTTLQSSTRRQALDRHLLKVGDAVGFKDRNQQDVYGVVVKLNPKTATIKLPTGVEWLIYYEHLFTVMEGEYSDENIGVRLNVGVERD